MSDFIIESKGYCFLCLDEISPRVTARTSTVHSLQYLSKFLGVDRRKIFPDTGNIPRHLLTKVEKSRLKGELCDGCAALNDSFSKVCRRLEKLELEAISSLEHIYRKLVQRPGDADQLNRALDAKEESRGTERDEWSAKRDILKILRTDAIQKCSVKLGKARPRVKVQNMTKRDIIEIEDKFKYKSGELHTSNLSDMKSSPSLPILQEAIKSELDDNFSDTWHDDPDTDTQADFKHDFDESNNEDETHTSSGTPKQERCVPLKMESGTRTKLNKKKMSAKTGIRVGSGQNGISTESLSSTRDLTISENIEMVQGKGEAQNQYRCKQCDKLLAHRRNAIRHIQTVHLKERRHRCSICNKAYSDKKFLRNHMNYHKGVKPHMCHVCPSRFSDPTTLRRHLLVHSEIRQYKCNLCDKAFTMRHVLTRHLKTHNRKSLEDSKVLEIVRHMNNTNKLQTSMTNP